MDITLTQLCPSHQRMQVTDIIQVHFKFQVHFSFGKRTLYFNILKAEKFRQCVYYVISILFWNTQRDTRHRQGDGHNMDTLTIHLSKVLNPHIIVEMLGY